MIDLEKRAKAWDEFSGEAREFTIGDTFNSAYELGVRDGAASVPRWTRVEDGLPEVGRRCWITVNGEVRLGGLLMMTQILPPCEKLPPVPKWRHCTIAGQDMGGVSGEVTAWQYFNEPKPFGGDK